MPKIIIDGMEHEVSQNKNLLDNILMLGYDLPYFCWHPALGSVGSCRQCAVRKYRNEEDKSGQIVMSCMEGVTDNLRISITEKAVQTFRKNVIEWLMINHPHDCPICDEGGECHLQDMTVMAGHAYRRFRFKKRTYANQYLGPCINHEMNRCIQCYRCVRFYNDFAGGDDLQVFSAHDHVYFGRYEEGTLESEFSGNLVEVCPTGVFTDKTLKNHYTRKWDLTSSPSICHLCSLGCNILASERYGSLRRILSRFNGEVNGYFTCDRGRFGYDFVNRPERIVHPMIKGSSGLKKIDKAESLSRLGQILGKGNIMGIGSPRASLESNFALRALVGKENFYNGTPAQENKLIQMALNFLQNNSIRTPSLKDVEKCDAVIIIGEDVTHTAPMMDMAVKQSVRLLPLKKLEEAGIPIWHDTAAREYIQDEKGPLYILTPQKTKLDRIARKCYRDTPENLAKLVHTIAKQLDTNVPGPAGSGTPEKETIKEIASTLARAERPLVITGISLGNEALLKSVINLAVSLYKENSKTEISFVFPECNTLGVAMMEEKSMADAVSSTNEFDTLMILENDLFRRLPYGRSVDFLNRFKNIVVLDHTQNSTTSGADLLIPAGTFAEADGTLVNNEGRAQRFFQVQAAGDDVQESWRWIAEAAEQSDKEIKNWRILDDVIHEMESELSCFKGISKAAPAADFRINSQKIARAPHRYSGRTAMFANRKVNEPRPPQDPDSPFSFTMEGFRKAPSSSTPFYWSPGWNSVQAINKFHIELGGPAHKTVPGIRLIEPLDGNQSEYITDIPGVSDKTAKWVHIPVHHIFGSEELSMKSEAIAQRSPKPCLTINDQDAKELGIADGDHITVISDSREITLPVRIDKVWPLGALGFPVGFPGIPYIDSDFSVKSKNRKE